jgi:rubrerythrin
MDKEKTVYFSDLEGLRIAMGMEENGYAFYKKAQEASRREEHKALFAKLAEEESIHLKKFTQMYNDLKAKKQAESDEYLFDADASKYLTALSSPEMFTEDAAAELKKSVKTVRELLKMAIQDEKEAVLFYDALAKNSKFEDTKKIFSALKAEEQSHIVRLRDILLLWQD